MTRRRVHLARSVPHAAEAAVAAPAAPAAMSAPVRAPDASEAHLRPHKPARSPRCRVEPCPDHLSTPAVLEPPCATLAHLARLAHPLPCSHPWRLAASGQSRSHGGVGRNARAARLQPPSTAGTRGPPPPRPRNPTRTRCPHRRNFLTPRGNPPGLSGSCRTPEVVAAHLSSRIADGVSVHVRWSNQRRRLSGVLIACGRR
jgi:hypothetical protein